MNKQMPVRRCRKSDVEKHEGGASRYGCVEIIHLEDL